MKRIVASMFAAALFAVTSLVFVRSECLGKERR